MKTPSAPSFCWRAAPVAPIKSIVENAIATGLKRPMTLYWGSRDLTGLYQFDIARGWEAGLPGFQFVPVLSDAPASDGWTDWQFRSSCPHGRFARSVRP